MTSAAVVPACLLAAAAVVQPPHLEGDASLATEILPGPPPLASIQQAGLPRKDHKKTLQATSYLPISDPGTTYGANTVSTMAAATTEVDGPRRKRARLDKVSASSRSQRASARNNHTANHTPESAVTMEAGASSSHLAVESDPSAMQVDSDDAMLSRSNSVQLADEEENGSSRRSVSRRDKGKGKERVVPVRVKEEPAAVSLNTNDSPHINASSNEDHCSSCRSLGSLIYCDGCPRAFHLLCLDPPMDPKDLPAGDTRWFCPACMLKQQKPPPHPPSSLKFMAPLVDHLQSVIPSEYQLPQDIRTFFKDVATGPKGTYEDSSEFKVARLNRHGQLEERDPYRLKDRNGEPVLCFRCGSSALPPSLAATSPSSKRQRRANSCSNTETGRSIISCDYCHLHWHLDCVDPPLAYMPPWNRKWMCPNHAEHVLQPKHRIPKNNAPSTDIMKPGQWNNGNIEVIQPEIAVAMPPKIHVDEVLINGRRYRVPERIITMDFWNKTGKYQQQHQDRSTYESGMSSPLTSLSGGSDDEADEYIFGRTVKTVKTFDLEQLRAAMSLCGLHTSEPPSHPSKANTPLSRTSNVKQDAPQKTLRIDIQNAGKSSTSDATVTATTNSSTTNGVSQPESAGVRRSSRRPRPAKTHGFAEDLADLSEDSREFWLPEHSSRKQRRDANGKFTRKERGSYRSTSSVAPAEPVASGAPTAQQNVNLSLASSHSGTAKLTSDRHDGVSSAATEGAVASRPKRNRHPSRRAESPVVLTLSNPVQSNGNIQLRTPILNVPAPTSLHPSLRYKSVPPIQNESLGKVATQKGSKQAKLATSTSTAQKASSNSTSINLPATKTEPATTPSTGLKIRLPRISTVISSTVTPTSADVGVSTKTHSSSETRPRRSLRRQTSVSTSMTGTSLSTPSSPKANGIA